MIEIDRSDWRRVRFGDVIQSITDRVDDPSTAGVERYVGLEHLDAGSFTINRWGSPADVEATKLRFEPRDVVFARRRAYQRKLGQADFEGIASAHSLVLRARPDSVLPEFLPVFLSSDVFMDRAIQISVGSLSPTVNWKTLAIQEFDLPPLDEQKRIADLMWAAEQARLSATSRIARARTYRSRYLEQHLSPDTAAPALRLRDLVAGDGIRIGPFGSALHAHDYSGEPDAVPVVMPQDMVAGGINASSVARVGPGKAQELAAYRLRQGDILLPRRGELDRRALVTQDEEGWLCGTGSVRVRLKPGIDPGLILRVLEAPSSVEWLRQNATGTTMPNLNAKVVSDIPMPAGAAGDCDSQMIPLRAVERAIENDLAALDDLTALRGLLLNSVLGGSR